MGCLDGQVPRNGHMAMDGRAIRGADRRPMGGWWTVDGNPKFPVPGWTDPPVLPRRQISWLGGQMGRLMIGRICGLRTDGRTGGRWTEASGVGTGGPAGTSKDSREHNACARARAQREGDLASCRHPLILFLVSTMAAMDAAVEIVLMARTQSPFNSGAGGKKRN